MIKHVILLTMLYLSMAGVESMAQEMNPLLFSGFSYGMEKNSVSSMIETQPCPEAPNNSLLLCSVKPQKFLAADWQAMFIFNNLNQLQQVKLVSPPHEKVDFWQLQAKLKESDWLPQFLETDEDALDIIHIVKTKGNDEAAFLADEFEKKALENNWLLTVNFLPKAYAETFTKLKKIKNYDAAIDRGKENLVVLSLIRDDGRISLLYTAPLLSRKNALRYGEMIKR